MIWKMKSAIPWLKKKLEKKRPDELTNDEVIERLFGKTVLKELKDEILGFGPLQPLLPGHTYNYRVAAYNATGLSLWNENGPVTATTLGIATFPPAAPTALTADAPAVLPIVVNLAWTDNADSETGFVLERALDAAFTTGLTSVALPADTMSYTDSVVDPNVTYYYRVSCFNDGGLSAFSNVATVTTPGEVPVAPSNLRVVKIDSAYVILTWMDNSANETGFAIERSQDGINWSPLANTAMNIIRYRDSTVAQRTAYWYRVRAFNVNGYSAYSGTVSVTTK